MTNSDTKLNDTTNLPHRLRLGDVLGSIELSPGEISTFLGRLAEQFLGGAHHNMGMALRDHAAMVASPETYGYKTSDAPASTMVEPYAPPSTPAYAESFGGKRDESPAETRGMPSQAEAISGGTTTRVSIPAHPTDINPFATPARDAQVTPPVSADLPGPERPGEPAWMAEARRAGWNDPTRATARTGETDETRDARNQDTASARDPHTTYRAPGGPPVDPAYRSPYTRTGDMPTTPTPPTSEDLPI